MSWPRCPQGHIGGSVSLQAQTMWCFELDGGCGRGYPISECREVVVVVEAPCPTCGSPRERRELRPFEGPITINELTTGHVRRVAS